MFGNMDESQLKGAIEAMLFVNDEPVSVVTLADMLETTPGAIELALEEMRQEFEAANRGIQLRELAGGWRLFTHPVYHDLIERYVVSWDTRRLSHAALETLAVIAYGQPMTRAGVANIRGVNSDSSINSLLEKGLLRELGVEDAPGNPVLYGTSRAFLERFGLRSVDELPPIEDFAPDDETRAFITERLSAVRTVDSADDAVAAAAASFELEESFDASSLAESFAAGLGAVEKIDFDELSFE